MIVGTMGQPLQVLLRATPPPPNVGSRACHVLVSPPVRSLWAFGSDDATVWQEVRHDFIPTFWETRPFLLP
jgi:uncharacterized protein YigA (DUF484 family)